MSMLTRGQLKLNMDFVGSEDPIDDLSHIADRLTLGVLCVGFLIAASAIVMSSRVPANAFCVLGVPGVRVRVLRARVCPGVCRVARHLGPAPPQAREVGRR